MSNVLMFHFLSAARQKTDFDLNPPVQPCPFTRSMDCAAIGNRQGSSSGSVRFT